MSYNEFTIERGKHHFHQKQLDITSCKQKERCTSTRRGNAFLKFRTLQYTADKEKWKGTGVEMEGNANPKTS